MPRNESHDPAFKQSLPMIRPNDFSRLLLPARRPVAIKRDPIVRNCTQGALILRAMWKHDPFTAFFSLQRYYESD